MSTSSYDLHAVVGIDTRIERGENGHVWRVISIRTADGCLNTVTLHGKDELSLAIRSWHQDEDDSPSSSAPTTGDRE